MCTLEVSMNFNRPIGRLLRNEQLKIPAVRLRRTGRWLVSGLVYRRMIIILLELCCPIHLEWLRCLLFIVYLMPLEEQRLHPLVFLRPQCI
jgi:hypothetical protein